MKKLSPEIIWPLAVMVILFLAAVIFRPLLPIDETRYMTVAWEMRLQNGWLAPLTMNFEPYHHKPPMLFWMINAFWSVFGVSRWAGLIPVTISSLLVIWLTSYIGSKILPAEKRNPSKTAFLMIGSVPFLIYSTLVMFDLTLTVFVLGAFACLLTYAEKRQFRYMFFMGLMVGLGVLTKGPVAYLYIIFPILLGPLWVPNFSRPVSWYGDSAAAIFLSVFPVCFWLFPVLAQSDNHFAFWLLWEQTAGRVTGNFSDAHVRPFYFYLPLLPIMFAPWIFFPSFWWSFKAVDQSQFGIRFLMCWIIPVFIAFSFISGKQPHYLLPLLPGIILCIQNVIETMTVTALRRTALSMVAVIVIGQAAASVWYFSNYDLRPVAGCVQKNPDHPWAFVRNYHGEVGFLAKLQTAITDRKADEIDEWFDENPDGWAVIRYKTEEEVSKYQKVFSQNYRGKKLGVFRPATGNTSQEADKKSCFR